MIRHRVMPVVLAVALAGCATAVPANHFDTAQADASHQVREAVTTRPSPWFRVHEGVWLGATAVNRKGRELPAIFDKKVTYQRLNPVSLTELADHIAANHGLAVIVNDDALAASRKVGTPQESLATVTPMANLPPIDLPNGIAPGNPTGDAGVPQLPTSTQRNPAPGAGGGTGQFQVEYTGTLRGFLDHIASRTGNGWRYDAGRVVMFHTDTRVFRVGILPGQTSMASTITNESKAGGAGGAGGGGESGGASSTSGGGTTTSLNVTTDAFTAAADTVKSMLSDGGKMNAAPSLGTITVTDVPVVLDRVDRYIEQLNAMANRSVYLDVKVYAIEHAQGDSYGIQWDLVWRNLSKSLGVGLNGGSLPAADGVNGQFAVLGEGKAFSGTTLLLQALSTQGKVSQVTSASVVTLSGQAVPVQVAEETGYISSSEVSLVPNVGQQVSRTASKVTTGFSMVLLPVINDGKKLLLQAQINLSNLRQLRQVGSMASGSMVEVPLVDSRQVLQRVPMVSGQTLVLTGYEQDAARADDSGVGSPAFKLLGGSTNNSRRRTTLVILITPQVAS